MRAYEGYAVSKGVKKRFNPSHYPSAKDREKLHSKLMEKHGHA